jgi:hypothetical protein
MAEAKEKKIKVVRPIIIDGQHAEAGSVHSLPRHKAIELIGSGLVEEHLEDGEDPEAPASTVRVDKPQHGDPTPKHGDPEPNKRAVPAKK